MPRLPDQCPHRVVSDSAPSADHVHCEVLRQRCELPTTEHCWIAIEACVACCRQSVSLDDVASESPLSPVMASLMLEQLSQTIRVANWTDERRQALSREAIEQLSCIVPDSAYKPGVSARTIVWAVGVLTAPRKRPTLEATLFDLKRAGFADVQLFAEPGADIPAGFQHLPVTRQGRALGVFGNTVTALSALYLSQPQAEAFALFQDDISVAEGLRAWCNRELWPSGQGLVSLFTMKEQSGTATGWQVAQRGMFRTFGALGFIFRRDVLLAFLSDHRVWLHRQSRRHGSDAAIGEWATRTGHGIAYHTPSLLQHRGETSAAGHSFDEIELAHAIPHVRHIANWQRPKRQPGRVGLVGWNTASGLGYVNRELATHYPIERWLAPQHPCFPSLEPLRVCRTDLVPAQLDSRHLYDWLRGLDWVLFAELPYLERLAQHARERYVRVACIPMWEWLHPQLDWLNYVDVMLCPTRFTFDRLTDWKRRHGFCWDVVELPWPIDASRFAFRQRRTCERLLFINGTGGGRGTRADGTETGYHRKGAELVAEAARLLPDVPFIWYSQTDDLPPLPPNVRRRPTPADSTRLYDEGDVCVQPSTWEGIGLQLLECQAAGMPLVTTEAAPMNEFQPLRTVRATHVEQVRVFGSAPISSHVVSPTDLAATLRLLLGTDLTEASRSARRFVERQHSWSRAKAILSEQLFR